MRGVDIAALALTLLFIFSFSSLLLPIQVVASYTSQDWWFQSGVTDSNSVGNYGANVTIQTILTHPATTCDNSSFSFWVGNTLQSGTFIQLGYMRHYLINPNSTRLTQQTTWSEASWFYEFTPKGVVNKFLGKVGPIGSAGVNGSFHTYSMISANGAWNFYMDNKLLRSVPYSQLGGQSAEQGGDNITAHGEISPGVGQCLINGGTLWGGQMPPVTFTNFLIFAGAGGWHQPHKINTNPSFYFISRQMKFPISTKMLSHTSFEVGSIQNPQSGTHPIFPLGVVAVALIIVSVAVVGVVLGRGKLKRSLHRLVLNTK